MPHFPSSSPGTNRRFLAVMVVAVAVGAMTVSQTAAQNAAQCAFKNSCADGFTMGDNPSPRIGQNPCECCDTGEISGACTGTFITCTLAALPNCVSCSSDDICGDCARAHTLNTGLNTCDADPTVTPSLFLAVIHAACPAGTLSYVPDAELFQFCESVCCEHYTNDSDVVTKLCGDALSGVTGPAHLNCESTIAMYPFQCCGAVSPIGSVINEGRSCPKSGSGDAAAGQSARGIVVAVAAAAVALTIL